MTYFVLGRIGFLVAIQPGNVSPIWLPAGVAMLSTHLLGKKVLPGVWLGSFAVNFWFYLHVGNPISLIKLGVLSSLLALGVVFQSLFWNYLLYKSLSKVFLSDERFAVIKFAFIIAPITAIINATWCLGILSLFGAIRSSDVPFSWVTWWSGDVAGIIVITSIGLLGKVQWDVKSSISAKPSSPLSLSTFLILIFTLLFTLSGSWLIATRPQPNKKLVVGISRWATHQEYDRNITAFKEHLARRNFVEGKNLEIIVENPEANKEVQKSIIQKFVAQKVDLIYSLTTPGTLIAKEIATSIPIVFSVVTYPVETGVIKALNDSGNLLVGTRNYIPMKRQLEFFLKIFPKAKNIGFVHRKGEPNSEVQYNELKSIAQNY